MRVVAALSRKGFVERNPGVGRVVDESGVESVVEYGVQLVAAVE